MMLSLLRGREDTPANSSILQALGKDGAERQLRGPALRAMDSMRGGAPGGALGCGVGKTPPVGPGPRSQ